MKKYIYRIILSIVVMMVNQNPLYAMNRNAIPEEQWHNPRDWPCQQLSRICAIVGQGTCNLIQGGIWMIHQIDIDAIFFNALAWGVVQEQRRNQ